MRTIRFFTILWTAAVSAGTAFGERFSLGDETIRAKISLQHPNRISLKNDAIASVSGLEQAFSYEKNEKTGDGFIRPTEANGKNPIALSLTTVSGRTQDLLLEPTDGDPHRLELVNDDPAEPLNGSEPLTGNDNLSSPAGDHEKGIAEAVKRAAGEKDIVEAADSVPDRNCGIFRAKFQSCCYAGGWLCLKFLVTTEIDGELSPDERIFAREGDAALSFSNPRTGKGKPIYLYVLRR